MSHPILERHLQRGALKPLYLFYGDEEFLMQRALKRLGQALTDRPGAAPKVALEAQEVALPDFLAQARVAPLWGPGQLLVCAGWSTYPRPSSMPSWLSGSPRAPGLGGAPGRGLKARDLEKNAVWDRLPGGKRPWVSSI